MIETTNMHHRVHMDSTTEQREVEGDNFFAIAAEGLRECNGDRAKACDRIRRQLKRNKTLMAEAVDMAIDIAVDAAIRNFQRTSNARLVSGGQSPYVHRPHIDEAEVTKSMVQSDWYGYALPYGEKLGEADKAVLLKAFNLHDGLANGNALKATWLNSILARMDNKRTVSETLTIAELAKLYEKAKKLHPKADV